MKKIKLLSVIFSIFFQPTYASALLINPSIFFNPILGVPWTIYNNGANGLSVSCNKGLLNKNLATYIVVNVKNGQVHNTGIDVTCTGINGITHEHVNIGETSKTCIVSCAANNSDSLKWISDINDKQSSGMYYSYDVNVK